MYTSTKRIEHRSSQVPYHLQAFPQRIFLHTFDKILLVSPVATSSAVGMTSATEASSVGDNSIAFHQHKSPADHQPAEPHDETHARPPMRKDPMGIIHLGADGVLRSLNADHTAVLDYRRLSPEEIKPIAAHLGKATQDAMTGVDGRDVMDVEQLWAVPEQYKGRD